MLGNRGCPLKGGVWLLLIKEFIMGLEGYQYHHG